MVIMKPATPIQILQRYVFILVYSTSNCKHFDTTCAIKQGKTCANMHLTGEVGS